MVRNEIWEELKKAKTYQICCLHYTDKKRNFNRRYNFIIIGVATIGAPTFFLNHWCAFVSTICASILEIVKNFIPTLCQSEEELVKIDNLATYFGDNVQKLELLWNTLESTENSNRISISKELSKILKDTNKNIVEMNKLIHSLKKEEDLMIQNEVDEYLKRKFYEQK